MVGCTNHYHACLNTCNSAFPAPDVTVPKVIPGAMILVPPAYIVPAGQAQEAGGNIVGGKANSDSGPNTFF